jgi:hypothetical protein
MHKKRYETPADYKIFRIIVFKTMDSVGIENKYKYNNVNIRNDAC